MTKPKRKPFIPVCSCADFSNCDHYNFPESPEHARKDALLSIGTKVSKGCL